MILIKLVLQIYGTAIRNDVDNTSQPELKDSDS